MRIQLEEVILPEEVECAFCERPFVYETTLARAISGERTDAGETCPECAEWLSRGPMAQSGKFPKV